MLGSVLLTGGGGYIGRSISNNLLLDGYNVIIVDNFENSNERDIDDLPNKEKLEIYKVDCCEYDELEKIFKSKEISIVIHLAGYKSVEESIRLPLKYYENNLVSIMNILNCIRRYKVKKMIFSSSATVYGKEESPLKEVSRVGVGITNPYGMSKYMGECIISDVARREKDIDFIILRYFNPVGSVENGKISDNPKDIPRNLIPVLINNINNGERLKVFGKDYNTKDGTPARDYIHIEDLAKGHIAAINLELRDKNLEIFNLGRGESYTVMEVISTFEKVNNINVDYEIVSKREGDLGNIYCDTTLAEERLGWKAEKGLTKMCDFRFLLRPLNIKDGIKENNNKNID